MASDSFTRAAPSQSRHYRSHSEFHTTSRQYRRASPSRESEIRRLNKESVTQAVRASSALISWLKEGDCESVYCREIERAEVAGAKAVPEFASAFAAGEKELGNSELARKWLTTNLPEKLRDGFYKSLQTDLQALIKQAEGTSGARVLSVMTDRNGTAYFTDLEPGTYVLSSLLPTEIGALTVSWTCEVQIKQGDLATQRPYLVSNTKDKNVKCVGVERPLPVCEPPKSAGR